MYIFKEVTKREEALNDIICDICGQSCIVDEYEDNLDNICPVFEYSTLSAEWGYDSKHDMERPLYHFCESCFYDKLIPFIENPNAFMPIPPEPSVP